MTTKSEKQTAGRPERAAGNFYGRRKAQPLNAAQLQAYERIVPERLIDLSAPAPSRLQDLFAHQPEEIVLEIGFGGGEHLLHRAGQHPSL
jgi:tRNA (guanine-N7-)-methyltransferase